MTEYYLKNPVEVLKQHYVKHREQEKRCHRLRDESWVKYHRASMKAIDHALFEIRGRGFEEHD